MKILFIHNNFPGQFRHLAQQLLRTGKHVLKAITVATNGQPELFETHAYTLPDLGRLNAAPLALDFQSKVIRGECVARLAGKLKSEGFTPDLIVAHPGWGETLFIRAVFPDARLLNYLEFFYHAEGYDVGFDPAFPLAVDPLSLELRIAAKNFNARLTLEDCDFALCPTQWQASAYPARHQKKIKIIHDGIDTQFCAALPDVTMRFSSGAALCKSDLVLTFVARNLEPYRGYHWFLDALPFLFKAYPNLHVVIVGGDGVSYGAPPKEGRSWREKFWQTVRHQLPTKQVHFVGKIPHTELIKLFSISTAHVYCTYPFVVSWSLLEAMSCGCAVVANRVPPVEEIVTHEATGLLFDTFTPGAMVAQIERLFQNRPLADKLGMQAREHIVSKYDLKTVCLPQQLNWLGDLVGEALVQEPV
jgi:glycosyltransferase involved in cell wall biosynthesis